ncbi:MAG: hypothetical protein AABW73_03875 [Nanoarchaeota archaeon]
MIRPKVLVAAPTFDGMKYCEKEFFDRIKSLDYPGYDVLIVDNSRNLDYFNELRKIWDITVIHDHSDEEKSVFRLISSRNLILEYAIAKDYSHVLMLDSDVIPPKNVIQELLACDKDIVSGLYYNFFVVSGQKKWLPVAWKLLTVEEFSELQKIPSYSSLSRSDLRRHITPEEIDSGAVLEVNLPSAGCMLISRDVFLDLRYGKFSSNGGADDDRFFIDQAFNAGFVPFCNPKVLCDHLVKEKYVDDGKGNLVHKSFSDMIK